MRISKQAAENHKMILNGLVAELLEPLMRILIALYMILIFNQVSTGYIGNTIIPGEERYNMLFQCGNICFNSLRRELVVLKLVLLSFQPKLDKSFKRQAYNTGGRAG